jgi:hypothetical protein
MKKFTSAIISICLFVSCSSKIYDSSGWQSQKVTVDGKINEWSNPLRFYDQQTGISYNISNDRNNIYFAASISNEFLQTKILRSGLEFRIDTLGKKSFGVSFKYPIGILAITELKPNNPPAKEGFEKGQERSSFKLKLLAEATEMQLVGFKPRLGKIISLSVPNNAGISAAINFDASGIMNYEAVIPFSTFYRSELISADSGKVFNFQIKVNPLANSGNASGNSSGMRGGGMRGGGGGGGMRSGGMGGGGMRGGGMGGGGMRGGEMNGGRSGNFEGNDYQRNSNLSGVTKTTIKLKLAYK